MYGNPLSMSESMYSYYRSIHPEIKNIVRHYVGVRLLDIGGKNGITDRGFNFTFNETPKIWHDYGVLNYFNKSSRWEPLYIERTYFNKNTIWTFYNKSLRVSVSHYKSNKWSYPIIKWDDKK
jgi:hypothetical protein